MKGSNKQAVKKILELIWHQLSVPLYLLAALFLQFLIVKQEVIGHQHSHTMHNKISLSCFKMYGNLEYAFLLCPETLCEFCHQRMLWSTEGHTLAAFFLFHLN